MFNEPQLANDTEHWCARTVFARPTTTARDRLRMPCQHEELLGEKCWKRAASWD
jgi:hypothetical protein